ncbi:hypothetical protein [Streptomyces sp. NPDC057545]|uniref:hypothetical protein n=1 Tax=Streptomyces sp. NPDC057545 TaxID=3346164 RepID=UPI003699EE26
MSKKDAVQAAVNAVATATTVINSYGKNSREAASALQAARDAVTTARRLGATDNDLRNARPQ